MPIPKMKTVPKTINSSWTPGDVMKTSACIIWPRVTVHVVAPQLGDVTLSGPGRFPGQFCQKFASADKTRAKIAKIAKILFIFWIFYFLSRTQKSKYWDVHGLGRFLYIALTLIDKQSITSWGNNRNCCTILSQLCSLRVT